MELKKSRQDSQTTNNSKNLQKAPDGSYTYRTTEMDENGEEVEIIKTVHPDELNSINSGALILAGSGQTPGQVALAENQSGSKMSRHKIEEKRVFIMDGKTIFC